MCVCVCGDYVQKCYQKKATARQMNAHTHTHTTAASISRVLSAVIFISSIKTQHDYHEFG